MVDPQIVREWMEKAEEDFAFAVSVLRDSTFYAQICFHFHQAAEKFLKSFVIAHDLEFKKIHDLPVILESCMSVESSLCVVLEDCRFLNRFYIETRYPVHWPTHFTKEEASKAKDAADHIRQAIRGELRFIM